MTHTWDQTCREGHVAPRAAIDALHEDQGGPGRHKCAVCAWRAGFDAGHQEGERLRPRDERMVERGLPLSPDPAPRVPAGSPQCRDGFAAPARDLESQHEDQGGAGRHRCPTCAWRAGWAEGVAFARVELRRHQAA